MTAMANNEINLRHEIRKLKQAESQLDRQAIEINDTKGFLRDILDSVDANICIVDEAGVIIDTNACWKQFETNNSDRLEPNSIGANYLEICEQSTGECAKGANKVASALREIIRGHRTHFQAEYPCHTPDKKQWFQVRLTPLKSPKQRGVVIAHINVTDRVLATQKLEAKTQ
jgi:nitrogen fixation/metabolism regulation signal transduction histidine kinase